MDEQRGAHNLLWQLRPRPPFNIGAWRERGTTFCRGADISLLSQFSYEDEVLFPPCTMLIVEAEPELEPEAAGCERAGAEAGPGVRVPRAGSGAQPPGTAGLPPGVRECRESGRSFVSVTAKPCFA